MGIPNEFVSNIHDEPVITNESISQVHEPVDIYSTVNKPNQNRQNQETMYSSYSYDQQREQQMEETVHYVDLDSDKESLYIDETNSNEDNAVINTDFGENRSVQSFQIQGDDPVVFDATNLNVNIPSIESENIDHHKEGNLDMEIAETNAVDLTEKKHKSKEREREEGEHVKKKKKKKDRDKEADGES